VIAIRNLVSTPSRRLLSAVVAVALVAAVTLFVHHRLTALPDDAVLRFGDEVVTETEFQEHVDTLHALYGITQPKKEGDKNDFQRDVAKSLAVGLILDRAAKKNDIVISDKSARDTLASMLKQQMGPDPRDAFEKLLTEFGVSEADILEEIKRQQAIGRLFQKVTEAAVDAVKPEDAQKRYDADPAAFGVPEKRRIANIVVRTRKEARQVLSAVKKGEAFGELVGKYSLDDATRDKGGVLGTVSAGQLDEKYAAAAFDAKKGVPFGPVQTVYGWNVGIVQRVVPARERPYDEVREEALETVRSERAMKEWRAWLTRQIKDADVEYADAYLPENPDEPPQDAMTSRPLP